MSLVSRTSSDLFAILITHQHPEEVAWKFVDELANDPTNMNLQLTDLIFRCCNLIPTVDVPRELVRRENVNEIIITIERVIASSVNATPALTIDKKMFDTTLRFFESFALYYWCDRRADDVDAPFFKKLIVALSEVGRIPTVIFSSIRILSKFVTALFRNYDKIPEHQHKSVFTLLHKVMRGSFTLRKRELLKASLSELEQWLFIRPEELLTDDYVLRYIIWSVKEYTPSVIVVGLHIVERLLSDRENLPPTFLKQCGAAFAAVDFNNKDEIFSRVCQCCVKIRVKFRSPLADRFDRKLIEHLFAVSKNRKAAAADYWLALNYEADDHFQSVRNIIACINSFPAYSLEYLEYFVDALIDKCPPLTNWKLLGNLLVGAHEKNLTASERKVLLLIILHAVEQSVIYKTLKGPSYISTNEAVRPNNKETRRKVSYAFGPHLEKLFRSPDMDADLLLKLLKFFDFDTMPVDMRTNLIDSCRSSFEIADVSMQRVILEVMWTMKMNCDDATSNYCLETIVELKNHFETRVRDAMAAGLLESPAEYLDTVEGRTMIDTFLALRIIHAVVPVEKSIAFDAAIKLIRRDLPAVRIPAFMAVRELSVILSTSYVLKNAGDAPFQKTDIAEGSTSLSDSAKEAILLVLHLGSPLMKFVGCRNGLTMFGCLCDLALMFAEKDVINLFPKVALKDMRRFFLVALSQPDLQNTHEFSMIKFLKMIDRDIIPMEDAYQAFSIHCNVDDVKYMRCLHEFLQEQLEKRGTDFMVEWMTKLWIRLFEDGSKSSRGGQRLWQTYEKLRNLIYCIRFKIASFIGKCHIAGIDYATSEAKNDEFARYLSIFSPCLNAPNQRLVTEYVRTKDVNTPDMRSYRDSLKQRGNLKAKIIASPVRGSSATSSRTTSVDGEISRLSVSSSSSSTSASGSRRSFSDYMSGISGISEI